MVQVGSAEVEIRANLDPLRQGLGTGEEAVRKFQTSVDKFADSINKKVTEPARKAVPEVNKFSKGIQDTAAAFGLIPGPAGAAAARMSSLLTVATSLSPVLVAVGVAVGGVTLALSESVAAAAKFEALGNRTEAILKSTGHAAGLTGTAIRNFSKELSESTLATQEDVEKAAQALITFGNTSGDEFKRTLTLAQDLVANGFGPLTESVKAIGIAFDRPEQAARRFREIGLGQVVFLQAQALKDEADKLELVGDHMGAASKQAQAHAVILDALTSKIGGAGKGENKGLAGAYSDLGNATETFLAKLGNSGPLQAWTLFIGGLSAGVKGFTRDLDAVIAKVDKIRGVAPRTASGAPVDSVAADAQAKKDAEIAARARAADEARAKVLIEQKKARDEAAAAERALNIERAKAVVTVTAQTAALRMGVTAAIASNDTADETNRKLQLQKTITDQLTQLKLSAGSKQGAIIVKQLTDQAALTKSLQDELKARQELFDQVNANNALLNKVHQDILTIDRDTALVGQSAQKAAEEGFRQTVIGLDELGSLSEDKINEMVANFGRATASNDSAKFFKGLTDNVKDLNREVDAQTKTYGMSAQAAAAYRFEQQALYEQSKLSDVLLPSEAAHIHELAVAYGEAAGKLALLDEQARTSDFFNGEFESTLEDMIFSSKGLGESFQSLGQDISKAAIQAALFGKGPLASLFGTGGGAAGNSGGLLGGFFNTAGATAGGGGSGPSSIGGLLASIFHEGTEGPPRRRVVPVATFIRAPRFHDGLKPDEFPAILQRGEEVTSRKNVGKSKGGGPTYVWNVQTPDANSFMASKRQLAGQAKRTLDGRAM